MLLAQFDVFSPSQQIRSVLFFQFTLYISSYARKLSKQSKNKRSCIPICLVSIDDNVAQSIDNFLVLVSKCLLEVSDVFQDLCSSLGTQVRSAGMNVSEELGGLSLD